MLNKGFFTEPDDIEPNVEGFEFYFDAFRELSSCRPVGMSLSPIPFTAVVEYSRLYDVGDFQEFLEIIRFLDDTLLALEAAKSGDSGGESGNKRSSDRSKGAGPIRA